MNTNYKMSSAQKRIYSIVQMEPDSILYNVPMLLKSKEKIDVAKLEYALEELCRVHDVFRTSFYHVKDMFIQTIADDDSTDKIKVGFEKISQSEIASVFQRFVQPFDLEKSPLMRVKVVETKEEGSILILDIHHIIFDGGSVNKLFDNLSHLYNGDLVARMPKQYKDFASWHNKMEFTKAKNYWLEEFADSIPDLNLYSDYARPKEQCYNGETLMIYMEQDIKEKINKICRETETTEYIVLLTVLMIFLHKYTDSQEVVIGTPIHGRTHPDVEEMIGMFVNTLAIKGVIDLEADFYKVLSHIKEKCFNAFEYQDYPFEQLVENVVTERNPSRSPIFDIMFAFENIDSEPLKLGDAVFTTMKFENLVAKFDLTITIESGLEDYWVNWEYCTALFKRETIVRMGKQFKVLVEHLINEPDKIMKDVSICSQQDKQMILDKFNQAVSDYPKNSSVIDIFEEIAAKFPNQEAVGTEGKSITYYQLNKRANQLAANLRNKGVKPNQFIGIITERQIDTIIGILGIMKAGGAYMPIDPKYPLKRMEFMIKDSNCSMILTRNKKIKELLKPLVNIIDLEYEGNYIDSVQNLERVNHPEDLAYLIYTSGTTGEPKGVMIEHKSINRLVRNTNYVNFKVIRILQTGSMTFDASTFEIWGALLNGGSFYIAEEDVLLSVEALKRTMQINKINTMFITTALFNQLISLDHSVFDSLEQLLFGGEATSEEHVRILLAQNTEINFYNVYGPTESTTFALYYPICKGENERRDKTPIGKPISNTQAYIINESGLCAVGIPGELYLGGPGLARGYLNQNTLTKEKFIQNPYNKDERIYRTGDIVRWLEDGNIEYLGRKDDQVKIRGFRIELGEIEKRLRDIEGISDACVIAEEKSGDKYLCGYITGKNELTIPVIKDKLKDVLPGYMIPAYIMKIEKFPMNKNGKLDKKALPKIEVVGSSEYKAPVNEIEIVVLKVFEDILGINQIGVLDSFFELGGDSIKAIRMVSKLRELGYEISVRKIMALKTVKNISEVVNQSDILNAKQEEIYGDVDLTPIQEKFFKFNLEDPNHFNQSFMLECRDRIDQDNAEKAIQAVVSHHDILRASYQGRKQCINTISDKMSYELKIIDLIQTINEKELLTMINNECDLIQRSMNLITGALFKAALFKTQGKDFLFLCIHHLVVDGVSWRIIMEDLNIGYAAALKNREIILPNKTISYQKWSEELRLYSTSNNLNSELDFWLEVENKLRKSDIDFDKIRDNNLIDSVDINLSEEYTKSLLYKSNRAYNTEVNDLLLTALFRAVYAVTGNDFIAVNMEGHGRENIGKVILTDRTVGWFTNIYPFVVNDIGKSIEDDILNVMSSYRKIPNYGIGYSVLREITGKLDEIDPMITFNYLGEFGQENNKSHFIINEILHGTDISPRNQYGTPISVNGWIMNKKLQLSISYCTDYNITEFIKKLHNEFKQELESVIEHCNSRRLCLLDSDELKIDCNNLDIAYYIWKKFRIDSVLKEVKVDYKRYNILFVPDLTTDLRKKIVDTLICDTFDNLIPHYFVDMKYINQCGSVIDKDALISICSDSDQQIAQSAIWDEIEAYDSYLVNDIRDYFISPPMQKSFLQLEPPLIVNEKICIEGVYSKNVILKAIKKIIKNTDSLRFSYIKKGEDYVIYEHAFNDSWHIPYFCLANMSPINVENVNKTIPDKTKWKYADGQKNPLSMIAVTKVNEKEHVIHIVASHSIWDKMSSQIFEERMLETLLNRNFDEAYHSNTYKDYVKEINNSQNVNISLQKYIEAIHSFIEFNVSNKLLKSQSSILKLGEKTLKLFKEKPWDVIMYIFKIWSRANELTTESSYYTPAFILQEDRRYMKQDYINSMGAYLDFLPMMVDTSNQSLCVDVQANIESLQKIKREYHINYLNMISDKLPYLLMNELIFINYHGIFEMTYEALQRNLSILESITCASREIYVNSYGNYLAIFYPVFKRCEVDIEKVFENACNELENTLVKSEVVVHTLSGI